MDWYAGIGSRKTPLEMCGVLTCCAQKLAELGWGLRSGAALRADSAFELGSGRNRQIFVPRDRYKGHRLLYPIPEEAYVIAARHHPGWANMEPFIRALMARNCQQVLGPNLDDPSKFVLCWTPDGCEHASTRSRTTGGTGLAISVASEFGIPVFNMANEKSARRVNNWLNAY